MKLLDQRKQNEVKPKIGLFPTGHSYYWPQFPNLKDMGMKMYNRLLSQLQERAEIVTPNLVDTYEKGEHVATLFKKEDVDMVLIFPLGYTTSMQILPVARELTVPIRILNAHEDSSYDYTKADTAVYLHHEGVCCIPEYAGALVNLGRKFRVRTGYFDQARLWEEVDADIRGAAAARFFKNMNSRINAESH